MLYILEAAFRLLLFVIHLYIRDS